MMSVILTKLVFKFSQNFSVFRFQSTLYIGLFVSWNIQLYSGSVQIGLFRVSLDRFIQGQFRQVYSGSVQIGLFRGQFRQVYSGSVQIGLFRVSLYRFIQVSVYTGLFRCQFIQIYSGVSLLRSIQVDLVHFIYVYSEFSIGRFIQGVCLSRFIKGSVYTGLFRVQYRQIYSVFRGQLIYVY